MCLCVCLCVSVSVRACVRVSLRVLVSASVLVSVCVVSVCVCVCFWCSKAVVVGMCGPCAFVFAEFKVCGFAVEKINIIFLSRTWRLHGALQ